MGAKKEWEQTGTRKTKLRHKETKHNPYITSPSQKVRDQSDQEAKAQLWWRVAKVELGCQRSEAVLIGLRTKADPEPRWSRLVDWTTWSDRLGGLRWSQGIHVPRLSRRRIHASERRHQKRTRGSQWRHLLWFRLCSRHGLWVCGELRQSVHEGHGRQMAGLWDCSVAGVGLICKADGEQRVIYQPSLHISGEDHPWADVLWNFCWTGVEKYVEQIADEACQT